ncbi:MAG: corrinoid protein [Desulfosarcina sp.]|nr:corrinoid protein [Desulfosarcina sp.]MBC2764745.1 cobalamin-binding protein [Desulfosarcina sp.]
MLDSKAIMDVVMQGDADGVKAKVQAALDQGVPAGDILNHALIAGMDIVGDRMESGDMFIPEVLMAAQSMSVGLDVLKPLLAEEDATAKGRVIIGTVKGDLHDIGKNLVAMMLESGGLEVNNLGVDIPPEEFVNQVQAHDANMVCLSALLTTTMPMMKATMDALVEAGIRDRIKVMVGGAPVTQGFADEIGADGYSPDAGSAVKMAKAFFS